MYRGYELLTWENRLVDVGARRIRKFHQTELEIRLCRVMKRIISQALAVWNRTLAWGNPNMDAEPVDAVFDDSWSQASWKNKASGKSLNLGQIRAGKVSGSGHLPGRATFRYLWKFYSSSGLFLSSQLQRRRGHFTGDSDPLPAKYPADNGHGS